MLFSGKFIEFDIVHLLLFWLKLLLIFNYAWIVEGQKDTF